MLTNQCQHCNENDQRDCEKCCIYQNRMKKESEKNMSYKEMTSNEKMAFIHKVNLENLEHHKESLDLEGPEIEIAIANERHWVEWYSKGIYESM